MRTRTTPIVALAATAALLFGGSAALAIPSAPGAGPRRAPALPGGTAGVGAAPSRVSFRPLRKGFPNPRLPVANKGPSSTDAFARLNSSAFAVYGTSTVLHSDPELSAQAGVTVDMATADAAYATQQVSAFADELGRPVVTGLAPGSGQASARAVRIDPPDAAGDDVDPGEPAEAKAPPTGRPVVRENEVKLHPIVKADLLRAEAAARALPSGCVIGDDLSRGEATADDTDVADTDFDPKSTKPLLSLSADTPPRAVSHSLSRTRLVPLPGQPGRFGAVSEVRQTIAPVTFNLPGIDQKFTIEVGGEWVMRAAADGTKGTVSFGPENSSDGDRPAIRFIQGDNVVDEVGLREAGPTGIFVDGDPVGEIRVGGAPRAVLGRPDSKPIQTPYRVSAAADVVVVQLFEPHAELHVGHMEVGLAVPAGGVQCPGISLSKISDPSSVRPGDPFSWNLEVTNPNDCDLDQVKVTDIPSASPGVDWKPVTSVPKATRAPDGSLVFETIGPIATGETRSLTLNAEVEPGSALGAITNRAVASGICGGAPTVGSAEATTTIGTALVAALPAPAPGIAHGDRPARGPAPPSDADANPSREADSASVMASAMAIRSAAGTRPSADTRSAAASRPAAVTSQPDRARTATAPLPRSGSQTIPYLELALGLLGTGRIFRGVRARRTR